MPGLQISGLYKCIWRRPIIASLLSVRLQDSLARGLRFVSITVGVLFLASADLVQSQPATEQVEPRSAATMDVGQPLTAKELTAWVIERNAGLEAARATAEAAAHRIEPAGSLDDPTLKYAATPGTAGSDEGLNQRTEITQKLPWPGTLSAREARAHYEAEAAERDADSLHLTITALAKSAYAEWRYVARALEVHRSTESLLEELISTAETRYAAGRASRQDVLQARVELSELENHALKLQRQQASTRARINALLQRSPDSPLPPAAPIPLLPELPTAETLQQMALEAHPALKRLDAEIAAHQRSVALAEKAFYPDFQFGVGYNSLWEDSDKRATVSLSINVPLDRGKRHSELDRARAQVSRAEWALMDRRAQLFADLAEARAQVMEMQGTVQLYETDLLPLVEDYLDTAVADYRSGSGPFLNVITAEQRKLDTELALARARADYVRALAALERWTGRPLRTPEGE